MFEQEKKRQRILWIDLRRNEAKVTLSAVYKARNYFFYRKRAFYEHGDVKDWTKRKKTL